MIEDILIKNKERKEKAIKFELRKDEFTKYYEQVFNEIGYDDKNKELFDLLVGFCGPYQVGINKKGLFLCAKDGNVNTGIGKTFGMTVISKYFGVRVESVVKLCKAMKQSEIQYLDLLNGVNYFDSKKPNDKIIDEVGAEFIMNDYGVKYELFIDILESKYNSFISRGIFTHFTSNLTAKEIENRYGHRVWSRVNEMCTVIEVSGSDRRFE